MRTASPNPHVSIPPATSPVVTCIIVTYGTGPIVLRCLETLTATLAADEVAFEVVVVDNEHRWAGARTQRLLALGTSGLEVISPHRNLGFAGANNLAAGGARGDLIAFVNPDIEFRGGWFEPLIGALDQASIASPVLLNADGTIQETGHLIADDGSTWPITDDIGDDDVVSRPYASAACWLMRRSEFDRLGGFDTTYHPPTTRTPISACAPSATAAAPSSSDRRGSSTLAVGRRPAPRRPTSASSGDLRAAMVG